MNLNTSTLLVLATIPIGLALRILYRKRVQRMTRLMVLAVFCCLVVSYTAAESYLKQTPLSILEAVIMVLGLLGVIDSLRRINKMRDVKNT